MQPVYTLTMNPALDVSTSVDRLTPDHKLRCAAARQDPGGGGINVARVISRLGHGVTAIYPYGGARGQILRRLVDEENIRSLTVEFADETRMSFTVLESETESEYRFVLPGPTPSEVELRHCLKTLETCSGRAGFLVVSGSLPPGAPDNFFAQIAQIARKIDLRMVLDTSGLPLKAALKAGVFLVKPNLKELCALTAMPLEDQEAQIAACRELVRTGQAEIVALTLGDKGALLVTGDCAFRAAAIPIQPVSSVGAGDSFVGAMVWALAKDMSLQDSFRHGVVAGSAALLTPGTELCRQADVERLKDRVRLFQI